MRKGQRLRFTQPILGARAYLAAPGGFDAPLVLGSCASVVREALGGLDGLGKPLAKADHLSYSGLAMTLQTLADNLIPDFKLNTALDVIIFPVQTV